MQTTFPLRVHAEPMSELRATLRTMTDERPPEGFDLYRDGKWGRPFKVVSKSGQVDEYAANAVWTVDDDGALHVYGSIDQDEYVPADEGTRGRMDTFLFNPSAHYAPGDWIQEFALPE